MTAEEKQNYNKMRGTLILISKYQSVERLQKTAWKQYGLEFTEAIEMAYEDIRNLAKTMVMGIKELK